MSFCERAVNKKSKEAFTKTRCANTDPALTIGDTIIVASNGHLAICEGRYTALVDNYLRGLVPQGVPCEKALLRLQTKLARAFRLMVSFYQLMCFHPHVR